MTKLQKLSSYLITGWMLCVWAGSSIALTPVPPVVEQKNPSPAATDITSSESSVKKKGGKKTTRPKKGGEPTISVGSSNKNKSKKTKKTAGTKESSPQGPTKKEKKPKPNPPPGPPNPPPGPPNPPPGPPNPPPGPPNPPPGPPNPPPGPPGPKRVPWIPQVEFDTSLRAKANAAVSLALHLAEAAIKRGREAVDLQKELVEDLRKKYPDDGLSSKPKEVRNAERRLKQLKNDLRDTIGDFKQLNKHADKIPDIANPDKALRKAGELLADARGVAEAVWDILASIKEGAKKIGDVALELVAGNIQKEVSDIANQADKARRNIEPPKKTDPHNVYFLRGEIQALLKKGILFGSAREAFEAALRNAPPGAERILVKLPFMQHIPLMKLLNAIKGYRVQQRIKDEMSKRQMGQPRLSEDEKLEIEKRVDNEIANDLLQDVVLNDLIYEGERARQQMVGANNQIEIALKNLANSKNLGEAFKLFIKRIESGVSFEKALAEMENQVDPADKQQWESIKKLLQIYYDSKKKFEEITVLLLLIRNPDFPLEEKTKLYEGMVYVGGFGGYSKYMGPEAEKQKKIVRNVYKDGVYQGSDSITPGYDVYQGTGLPGGTYVGPPNPRDYGNYIYEGVGISGGLYKQPPPAPPPPPGP